jgi:hypothetical protein
MMTVKNKKLLKKFAKTKNSSYLCNDFAVKDKTKDE